jgi:hypothetical protein
MGNQSIIAAAHVNAESSNCRLPIYFVANVSIDKRQSTGPPAYRAVTSLRRIGRRSIWFTGCLAVTITPVLPTNSACPRANRMRQQIAAASGDE